MEIILGVLLNDVVMFDFEVKKELVYWYGLDGYGYFLDYLVNFLNKMNCV